MFDHLSIAVSDLRRSGRFYDAILGCLGHERVFQNPRAIQYAPQGFTGAEPPLGILLSGDEPLTIPKFHLAFAASDRAAVQRFHAAALAHGGTCDGPPGIRETYDPGYYAAFVLDPDGRRLEAVVHERRE